MGKQQRPADPEVLEGVPVAPGMAARVTGGVAGVVTGRVAGRVLRPVSRKVARRFGLPADSVTRIIEVAAPVVMSVVMAQAAKRKAKGGKEGPGAMPVVPEQPSAAGKH